MSEEFLQTEPQHERSEMITQADILSRLVKVQDSLFVMDKRLQEMPEWDAVLQRISGMEEMLREIVAWQKGMS